jgi:hypothetical protein
VPTAAPLVAMILPWRIYAVYCRILFPSCASGLKSRESVHILVKWQQYDCFKQLKTGSGSLVCTRRMVRIRRPPDVVPWHVVAIAVVPLVGLWPAECLVIFRHFQYRNKSSTYSLHLT